MNEDYVLGSTYPKGDFAFRVVYLWLHGSFFYGGLRYVSEGMELYSMASLGCLSVALVFTASLSDLDCRLQVRNTY